MPVAAVVPDAPAARHSRRAIGLLASGVLALSACTSAPIESTALSMPPDTLGRDTARGADRADGAASSVADLPAVATTPARAPRPGFFLTSRNPGQGGNFGGLEGADRHCQALASAVGLGQRSWRAYLSASDTGQAAAVHARDRIGHGPWFNLKGVLIASNLDDLHDENRIGKDTALTELGEIVSGRGDPVNSHDVLTGSSPAGRALQAEPDVTCHNWTSSDDGSAMVGHHDRIGLGDDEASRSWNASHRTRGCSVEALQTTGGDGRLYCFAAD